MRQRLAVLILAAGALAGCASGPEPFPEPAFEAYADPDGDVFADSRHCYAYGVHAFVLAADLLPLVPSSWSFEDPLAPEVRVLLHRCIEDFAVFVSVPMRAGGPGDVSAPRVDFLVEVFTNTTEDDWGRMGAPMRAATATVEFLGNGRELWRIDTDAGLAVRLDVTGKGSQGLGRSEVRQYGAGPDLTRSWADETASLTRPAEVGVGFGPGSLLKDARGIPAGYPGALAEASPSQWWGAFNAEYRLGEAP